MVYPSANSILIRISEEKVLKFQGLFNDDEKYGNHLYILGKVKRSLLR